MGTGVSKPNQNIPDGINNNNEIILDQSYQLYIGIIIGLILASILYKDDFNTLGERMWCSAKKNVLCGGSGTLCNCNNNDRSSCKEKFSSKRCGGGGGDRIPPYYSMSRNALRDSGKECNTEVVKDYASYAVPYTEENSETFVSDGSYDEEYKTSPGSADVNMYRGINGYGRNYGPPTLP